jgi:aminopeptidase C
MCIVGYDLNARYFIVENSWGPEWGDGGFCAMSFDNFLANAFDGTVIREFDGIKTSILPELIPPPPVVQPPKKKKKPWWKFW